MKQDFSHSTKFYSASIFLLIANNFASALHYVFQAMMKRQLSDADFGFMSSLIALGGFIALPFTIYANILTRQWAEFSNAKRHEEVDRLWCALIVVATGFGLCAVLIGGFCMPWLAWWLQTKSSLSLLITIVSASFGIVFGMAGPLVTAKQWFGLLAVGGIAGAFFRIAVGFLGIHLGSPLNGAVIATFLSGSPLLFLILYSIPRPRWKSLPFHQLLPSKKEWIAPALVVISSFCIMGVDLLIVRRVYDPTQAGTFAQVMILGRIILFLIGPLSLIVLPKTATSLVSSMDQEHFVVRRALALGLAILLIAATFICWLAPLEFQLLRGDSHPEFVQLLRIAVWCLVPLALCQLIIPALFARRQERFLLEFTLLSLLLPIGLFVFHKNLIQAFFVEGAVGVILLGFSAFRLMTFPSSHEKNESQKTS